MGAKATTIEAQIEKLKERGMIISDEEKAREVLSDIGYYRLGFYWFPFEKSYPQKKNRSHVFKDGTNFDDIVKLYYFDYSLRNILMKYLNRVEINFRTFLTHCVSNRYVNSPTWFADSSIVQTTYAKEFSANVYTDNFRLNPVIKRHHLSHINDKFAPAWKTIEFMTLGAVINLFCAIKDKNIRLEICQHFSIKKETVFISYINLVRNIRNHCAHGNVLFDLALSKSIVKGPVSDMSSDDYHNLNGALKVICYMVGCVSKNREKDLEDEINHLIEKYKVSPRVRDTLKEATGIKKFTK